MGARKLQSQADEVAWAVPLGSPESLLILAESWDVIFHVFMIKNTQITNRMQTSSSLYLQWGLGEWYRIILLTWSSVLLCCLGQNSSLCVWNLPNSVLLLSGDIKVGTHNCKHSSRHKQHPPRWAGIAKPTLSPRNSQSFSSSSTKGAWLGGSAPAPGAVWAVTLVSLPAQPSARLHIWDKYSTYIRSLWQEIPQTNPTWF